jgi:hypothetical protein
MKRMTTAAKPCLSNELTVYGVLATHLDQVWHEVIPLLNRALDYADDRFAVEDVYAALQARDMQLFVAMRHGVVASFCITQIVIYPRKKILYLLFAAGVDMHEWVQYEQRMTDWAKEQQCDAIEVTGRRGWARVLYARGYKDSYTVVRKEL